MKFFGGGVKKWITVYSSWTYLCDKCGDKFTPPEYPQTVRQYGDGLANWVVYQNVALGQNILKIQRGLREVFGLDIPQPTVHRFKSSVAKRYDQTNIAIIAELLRGPSLSIDETEVRLLKEKAYVWVFAGIYGAYYEYRDSRNGQFLAERLKGFSGVLVSDFFTAYDSIECPQQKCLIHLIRDLNNHLLQEPFNEEIKGIVRDFTTLLKPVIGTIDRFGLKTRFLKKYKMNVARFFIDLLQRKYKTELAQKVQARFRRNQGRLFTFIDYDNVPWNNNNAEHAIKAFAGLREVVEGPSTESGMRDYLMLLSICRTCEYRGIDFFEFLRSGEKGIGAFIGKRDG